MERLKIWKTRNSTQINNLGITTIILRERKRDWWAGMSQSRDAPCASSCNKEWIFPKEDWMLSRAWTQVGVSSPLTIVILPITPWKHHKKKSYSLTILSCISGKAIWTLAIGVNCTNLENYGAPHCMISSYPQGWTARRRRVTSWNPKTAHEPKALKCASICFFLYRWNTTIISNKSKH